MPAYDMVLVVTDREQLHTTARRALTELCLVVACGTLEEAVTLIVSNPPSLIIVDLGQLWEATIAACARIRHHTPAPLIVISDPIALKQHLQMLMVFDLGVDDYLVAPVASDTLRLSAEAIARRQRARHQQPTHFRSGALAINFASRTATVDGKEVALRPNEILILEELAQHAGTVVTLPMLLRRVYRDYNRNDENSLRNAIWRLRRRLNDDGKRFITTRQNVGYVLCRPDPEPDETTTPVELPVAAPRFNVPGQLTTFIGRQQELEALCALFERPDIRLVTLLGTAGAGKTRLSIELAHALRDRFADGVVFVPLAGVREADLVLSAIAQALDVREQGAQPLDQALTSTVARQEMLLILDNFEQVLDAGITVSTLLQAAPKLRVLVTSRSPLNLYGEALRPVAPLPLPDDTVPLADRLAAASVQLFGERAQRANPVFVLDADTLPAVLTVCRQMDGLPLAIELAAAKLQSYDLSAVVARLNRRLELLVDGPSDLPNRQRTMEAALDWSYSMLDDQHRVLLRRLGVFAGGCTTEAVATVCGLLTDADTLQHMLHTLVQHSLLRVEESRPGPRFVLLPIIQEFAATRLLADTEAAKVQARYVRFYRELAEEAEQYLDGEQQVVWLDQLQAEHDNIRAVLRWSLEQHGDATAVRISGAIWRFWYSRGYIREARQWLARSLEQPHADETRARAKALHGAAAVAWVQADLVAAQTWLEESIALHRRIGDRVGCARSLDTLGSVLWQQREAQRAQTCFEESLSLHRAAGNIRGCFNVLNSLGCLITDLGDYPRAEALFTESATLARQLGHTIGTARALANLGLIALCRGNYQRAHAVLVESLALGRAADSKDGIAQPLVLLGPVLAMQQQYAAADAALLEALTIYETLDNVAWLLECLEAAVSVIAHSPAHQQHALCIWMASAHQRASYALPLPPVDAERYCPIVAQLEQSLAAEQVVECRVTGQQLMLGETITFARQSLRAACETLQQQTGTQEHARGASQKSSNEAKHQRNRRCDKHEI